VAGIALAIGRFGYDFFVLLYNGAGTTLYAMRAAAWYDVVIILASFASMVYMMVDDIARLKYRSVKPTKVKL